MITILNLQKTKPSKPYDVIIDRRSPLGNPFYMRIEAQKEKVCNQYKTWFSNQIDDVFLNEYNRLLDIYNKYGILRLFCWCVPKQCHGETIKQSILKDSKNAQKNYHSKS